MANADVAKHLSFEDVSMHSPGVFSRFEAQRAREQPTVANLRRCAAAPPARALRSSATVAGANALRLRHACAQGA